MFASLLWLYLINKYITKVTKSVWGNIDGKWNRIEIFDSSSSESLQSTRSSWRFSVFDQSQACIERISLQFAMNVLQSLHPMRLEDLKCVIAVFQNTSAIGHACLQCPWRDRSSQASDKLFCIQINKLNLRCQQSQFLMCQYFKVDKRLIHAYHPRHIMVIKNPHTISLLVLYQKGEKNQHLAGVKVRFISKEFAFRL